jgi:hypothetical protein
MTQRSPWTRYLAVLAVIAAAFALFYAVARTPEPAPPSSRAQDFSAGRAMVDIAAMAPVPHPIGSPANRRVRDYLMGRMAALGLSPRIQSDVSLMHQADAFGPYVSAAPVENLIGVMPGRDPSLPALLLIAHYDSVPGSPGAADDVASVASILETVRAIRAGGAPARDVVVLFTDGEEVGLLGARAFFADDPLASRVGYVLNLDVRGGGGRALMFQTGANNGGDIALFRRTAHTPFANSVAALIYQFVSGDTDFTIARNAGVPGLNYAFFGREFDYHSPSSTVAALDQGAVQHLGQEVLPTARALAMAASLPLRAPDATYADFFGLFLIAYPAWAGWIVLAGVAALIGAAAWQGRRAGAPSLSGVAIGLAAGLVIMLGGAIVLGLARLATGVGSGWMAYRPLLARFPAYEAGLALTALSLAFLVPAALARLRVERGPAWIGALASGLVVGLVAQAVAPTATPIVVWPLALASAAAAVTGAGTSAARWAWALAGGLIVVSLALTGLVFHAVQQAMDLPETGALALWLASLALWPLAWPAGRQRRASFLSAAILLFAGLAVMAALRLTSPWSPRHPRAVQVEYLVEADAGRAWRIAGLRPGAWTRAVLGADGGAPALRPFPGLLAPVLAAPARPARGAAPGLTLSREAGGGLRLDVVPAQGVSHIGLHLRSSASLSGLTLDARPSGLSVAPGVLTRIYWEGSDRPFSLRFRSTSAGALDVAFAQTLPEWPATARPLPPLPRDAAAWDRSGSTIVAGRRRFAW